MWSTTLFYQNESVAFFRVLQELLIIDTKIYLIRNTKDTNEKYKNL